MTPEERRALREKMKLPLEERKKIALQRRLNEVKEKQEKFREFWENASVEEQHLYMQKFEEMQKLKEVEQQLNTVKEKQKQQAQKEFEESAIGKLVKRTRTK